MSEKTPGNSEIVRGHLREDRELANLLIEQTLIDAGKGFLLDVVKVADQELQADTDTETSTAGYERSKPGDEDTNTITSDDPIDPYSELRDLQNEAVRRPEGDSGVLPQVYFNEYNPKDRE